MTAPADFSIPTKVLSIDHIFFVFSQHFFLILLIIALESQQASMFLKKKLLNFIRPCANSIFNIHNPLGIKLLTRLRLGLSPLHEHKLWHCLQDTLNHLCECAVDIESTMLSFSTAQIFSSLDKPSFRKFGTLIIAFYLKVKRN